ncbi:hypothetical protein B0H13DRAFT_1923971 [Mycena leptocephala]|nr:hypothetical protein B0H13DRAFT_1923971 [Mycena leptocephala]
MASELPLFPTALQVAAPLLPDSVLAYSGRFLAFGGDLSWFDDLQFMPQLTVPSPPTGNSYFPFDTAVFLHGRRFQHRLRCFDVCSVGTRASSPAPISLQMNPPSPIEALNAELDPRNITMSVRARNPKRTFNDYSAAETKATKPDSKRFFFTSIPCFVHNYSRKRRESEERTREGKRKEETKKSEKRRGSSIKQPIRWKYGRSHSCLRPPLSPFILLRGDLNSLDVCVKSFGHLDDIGAKAEMEGMAVSSDDAPRQTTVGQGSRKRWYRTAYGKSRTVKRLGWWIEFRRRGDDGLPQGRERDGQGSSRNRESLDWVSSQKSEQRVGVVANSAAGSSGSASTILGRVLNGRRDSQPREENCL